MFVSVREKELERSCSLLSVCEGERAREVMFTVVCVREKEIERSCSLLSASLSFVLQFQLVKYDILALAGW